jgi:hypothetical protein
MTNSRYHRHAEAASLIRARLVDDFYAVAGAELRSAIGRRSLEDALTGVRFLRQQSAVRHPDSHQPMAQTDHTVTATYHLLRRSHFPAVTLATAVREQSECHPDGMVPVVEVQAQRYKPSIE